MTPAYSLQCFAKLTTSLIDVVKQAASKTSFTNALRCVDQVGGRVPGAPRLVRLHSHEEGRSTYTLESGVDPEFRQRQNSLAERAIARRSTSLQDRHALDKSMPPDHKDMVVQKATVLAKDYLRARATDAEPNWVTVGSRRVSSLPRARLAGQTSLSASAADSPPSSKAKISPPLSQKISTGFSGAFRNFIINVKSRIGDGYTSQASPQFAVTSPGKDVQAHTAEVLRSLRGELAGMVHLFGGSQRGDAARNLSNEVARVLLENGPDEALKIASQRIDAVRLASTKFIFKNIEPPRSHFVPDNENSNGRSKSDLSRVSSRSSSLPSVGSDNVFGDLDIAVMSGLGSGDAPNTMESRRSLTNAYYIRELHTIQKELFQIARKHPGTERGVTARSLHSATQRVFEVVDAKTACNGANNLLPLIRTMSTSQVFG
jgi:hypothetical protein